jgi:hypothetical protein
MKKLLSKLALLGFLFALISYKSIGQTTTKEITDKYFNLYSTDPQKAVEYGFSTDKWFDKKQDGVSNLKNKLKDLIELVGEYEGYELLSEKTAGSNIKMSTYIVRYEREPIRFTFLFYKPKDKWQVNNFSFDEDIDKDLEEATKAYRLRENNIF